MATTRNDNEKPRNSKPVFVIKTMSVHPKASSSDHHEEKKLVIALSNLDRQCPTLMYLVLFYENPYNDNGRDLVNGLKTGLEETLVTWHPAAGRLVGERGELNLWCNDEGAIFAEAVTEAKISDLGDLSEYHDFFESLVFKPDFDRVTLNDMPLVVAQVTKFGCGGYSIGVGTSHSLFDGPAAFNFLSDWASASNSMRKIPSRPKDDVFKPVHDRSTLLKLPHNAGSQTSQTSKAFHENLHMPSSRSSSTGCFDDHSKMMMNSSSGSAAIDHLFQLMMQQACSDQDNRNTNNNIDDNDDGFVFKTYHLSGSFVEGLKNKVLEEDPSFSCSSFEAVASLLWKARTKAMKIKQESMACLQFSIDTRKKVSPALPNGFSGNAYVLASVGVPAGDLAGDKLSDKAVIEKIREAKESVDNDYVRAYMDGLGLQKPDGHRTSSSSLSPLKALTLVSDWTRMPFHTLDFFSGGPTVVAPLVPPIPQVAYFMRSPRDPRGIDVRIGISQNAQGAFSSYFLNYH